MLKKITIFIISTFLLLPFVSCNDSKDTETEEFKYASTMVRSFSLADNANVLANLDTIYFSIDQTNARIFNADSLPYGTKVTGLAVNITVDGCREVKLMYRTASGMNTVDYLTHSTDTIDFSRGPVTLHLVSYDGTAERDYLIEVNVHKVRTETFSWAAISAGRLPTNLPALDQQRTVARGETAYCLTAAGTSYCMAVGRPGVDDTWTIESFNPGFEADVRSFTAADDAFYMLDVNGMLYRSTDLSNWSRTSQKWSYIYGPYGNAVIGVTRENGKYYHVRYPSDGSRTEVSADMPVSGTSNPVLFTTKWSEKGQMLVRGGHTAQGAINGAVYGYDGSSWMRITRTDAMPTDVASSVLFPYFVTKTDSASWVVTERSVLMSFGGIDISGEVDPTVHISYDMGISWTEAPSYLQLPGTVPDYYDADALIFESVMTDSRSTGAWTELALPALPAHTALRPYHALSRAERPITQWPCQMVYLYGGHTSTRRFTPGMYRGVINELLFKPLQ